MQRSEPAGRVTRIEKVRRDSHSAAKAADLEYATPEHTGIARPVRGSGFTYVDRDGHNVRDAASLARIKALAVPPAWTRVWISENPDAHIQAIGRDARGRKQYRYHARWRAVRDAAKYAHMRTVGECLPRLRAQVQRDLARPGLGREKVIAAIVRILGITFIRIGNDSYTRLNHTYGLTTLRDRHVRISGGRIEFQFRAKGGAERRVSFREPRLARIVAQCRAVPGARLFQYRGDDGRYHSVTGADVNRYLAESTGEAFTAKDFRTWGATVCATMMFAQCEPCRGTALGKREVVRVIKEVAQILGNTPAVCRSAYVHPGVVQSYLGGAMNKQFAHCLAHARAHRSRWLSVEEAATISFLRGVARRQARAATEPAEPVRAAA